MDHYHTRVEPVKTGLTAADNARALQDFIAFTELPEQQKERVTFTGFEGRERNTRAGYSRKTLKDHKQVFHYTDALQEHVTGQNLPKDSREFLKTAHELQRIALAGMKRALNEQHPLISSVHFPFTRENNHHLRFVLYDDALAGETIAAGHYDQSTITIALCESEEGLRLGDTPDNLKDYKRDPNQAVLFTGFGWLNLHKQLGIQTEYLPTWHDVIMPPRCKPGTIGRSAIILFANPTYLDTTPNSQQTQRPLSADDILILENQGVLRATSGFVLATR